MFTTKAAQWGARTGVLRAGGGGGDVHTPAFVVPTTRGAIEHLTPDHTPAPPVASVHAEEFFDRKGLVVAACKGGRLPLVARLVLASARRPASPAVTNKPNTADSVAVDTVQGARLAPLHTVGEFMAELEPDLFVVPFDVPAQTQAARVGANRQRKMETRSLAWLQQFAARRDAMARRPLLVAQFPPELRSAEYIAAADKVCDAYCFPGEGGDSAAALRSAADASKLRVGERACADWRQVLDEVSSGLDLVLVPVTAASNRGHALVLDWDQRAEAVPAAKPAYLDLHDAKYVTDVSLLGSTGHSLAYIHHLLEAGEMVAQVLLQQHNLRVAEALFDGIRRSIAQGTFYEDKELFLRAYAL